jgi:uncharacterized protein with PIN domain
MMRRVSSQNTPRDAPLPDHWWADEMLGRLARYLRMVGLDTTYQLGLSDDEVLRRSQAEGRTLLTRDRALARYAPGSVLLMRPLIEDQWHELQRRFPLWPNEPRFVRCTLCNGRLKEVPADVEVTPLSEVPRDVLSSGRLVYQCPDCRHHYWEGSHTESMRRRLSRWSVERAP